MALRPARSRCPLLELWAVRLDERRTLNPQRFGSRQQGSPMPPVEHDVVRLGLRGTVAAFLAVDAALSMHEHAVDELPEQDVELGRVGCRPGDHAASLLARSRSPVATRTCSRVMCA